MPKYHGPNELPWSAVLSAGQAKLQDEREYHPTIYHCEVDLDNLNETGWCGVEYEALCNHHTKRHQRSKEWMDYCRFYRDYLNEDYN